MANNRLKLKEFFIRKGFVLESEQSSNAFGDYLIEMSSPYFCIKALSDKSFEYIEIYSLDDRDNSYDLGLVKSYLLNEVNLTEPMTTERSIDFFEEHFDDLKDLFAKKNYANTKTRLDTLEKLRSKQMFPKWFE